MHKDLEINTGNKKAWINKDEWDFYRQWRKDTEVRMAKNIYKFNKKHRLDKLYEYDK